MDARLTNAIVKRHQTNSEKREKKKKIPKVNYSEVSKKKKKEINVRTQLAQLCIAHILYGVSKRVRKEEQREREKKRDSVCALPPLGRASQPESLHTEQTDYSQAIQHQGDTIYACLIFSMPPLRMRVRCVIRDVCQA